MYQLENNIQQKLSQQNLNTDKSFVLCFSHRVDQREKHRSLITQGALRHHHWQRMSTCLYSRTPLSSSAPLSMTLYPYGRGT